jgi:hypothetical protein
MTRGTRRNLLNASALLASAALLAGCFTVEATFTISDDATADLDYLIMIDTERFQELAGAFGEEAGGLEDLSGDAMLEEILGDEDPCDGLTEELTDYEVTTREINEDGNVGAGCTVSDVPIAELDSLGDDTSSFSIEQDDNGTRFNAVLEGVDEITGDSAETDPMLEALGLDLDELFTITFTVSAPGSLGENNATSTDGSTATWDVTPDAEFVADGDATMTAEWTPGGGSDGSSWWIILVVIGLVAVGAVVAFLLVKRSKGSSDPAGDAAGDTAVGDGGASDGATAVPAGAPAAPPPPPPSAGPSTPPPPPPPPPGASDLPPPPG